jgi:Tol biopolymer transport system component
LLVVEHEMPTPPKEEELAFYAFAPGETVPKRLYRAAGDSIFAQLSPDGRWAVVRSRPHRGLSEHLEIVDLLTGRSRPIDVPRGEGGCGFAWSRDGRTLACCYVEASEFHLTTFDPAVGTLSGSWFLESSWPEFLSLSADGRYAAYLGRSMLARQHVLDLRTGRCVRLWRSPGWYVFHSDYLAWSPTGCRFAVSRIAPGLPRWTGCVYLFEPEGR